MSNKKQNVKANSGNLKAMEEALGSKYADNAKKPATYGQYRYIAKMYAEVWLAAAGIEDTKTYWKAVSIWTATLMKYYTEMRKNPLTMGDVALISQSYDAGELSLPPAAVMKLLTATPQELAEAKPEPKRKKRGKVAKQLKARAEAPKASPKPQGQPDELKAGMAAILQQLGSIGQALTDLGDRVETLEAVDKIASEVYGDE